jgi:hypothetical protein
MKVGISGVPEIVWNTHWFALTSALQLGVQRKICAFLDLPVDLAEFERDAHCDTDEDDLRSLFGP